MSTRPARTRRPPASPCVLAIGGLDPGGGAGVLADARAIARAGAFACAAVTVLTLQSTSGLKAVVTRPPRELLAECKEVILHQRVRAIKVGALGSESMTRTVGDFLAKHHDVPAIVDTVMAPTRGRGRLLAERALSTLARRVLARATLATVNAPEAEALTRTRVTNLDGARAAAIAILELGPRAVLLKGGHLRGPHAVDLLAFAPARKGETAQIVEITAPRIALQPTHGGGCILASLVAGRLAVTADDFEAAPDRALLDAVRWAKKIHHDALANASDVGGAMRVLLA